MSQELNFEERKLKYFYAKVAQNKMLCVAYKFIPCETTNNTVFINAAGCIMEYSGSALPKRKMRHTASCRLSMRPLRWQHTFEDDRSYFRRLHIQEVVRANNCKGSRKLSYISEYFTESTMKSTIQDCHYLPSPIASPQQYARSNTKFQLTND